MAKNITATCFGSTMTTFKDLLSSQFNYLPSDFGNNDGEVVIDSGRGTVRPVGGDSKCVALRDIFKIGHYVSLDLHGIQTERLRFLVVGSNQDGLDAVAASGERGFLPWEVMAAALRRSRQVYVDVFSELQDLDDRDRAFVQEEIVRLTREIGKHRGIASDLTDQLARLESIGKTP